MDEQRVVTKSILEIKDEIYFVSNVFYIILGIVAIILVKLPVILEVSESINQIGHLAAGFAVFKGIFGVIRYFRSKTMGIKFNNDSICKGIIGLNINEIKEIHRISFLFVLDATYGIKRYNLFSRLILVLLIPIIGTLYILNIIFKRIYYKENTIHDILVIIGKNDKQFILVQLPLSNKNTQNELENYCKRYLDTDITTLKTKFFIPNNEKWFIESK